MSVTATTEISNRGSLTPEIKLHLVTPRCQLWTATAEKLIELGVEDPFWAIYWPGGQGLARYILNNPDVVHSKSVLDVGCGGGACAIAAKMAGASEVCANDINPDAIAAVQLNSALNDVKLSVFSHNLLGANNLKTQYQNRILELILAVLFFAGDVTYDEHMSHAVLQWIRGLLVEGKRVLLGCPGRPTFPQSDFQRILRCVAKYTLTPETQEENHGFKETFVWSSPHVSQEPKHSKNKLS
ncbi:unnamed protein product [Cyprideis torosa]|uniref:ETFB lysine methyltransferase n=1 Tax=Cyprideis torosa TaxID=163714 RepID=A0A7R8ZK51_9CRUS|nr:unnamed protein product [Cyprideis torosa]CAG0879544.1 unnamed protein product [Cyprideis torosa]